MGVPRSPVPVLPTAYAASRPLLITSQETVLDHVLAVAAAQGIDIHVAADIESARSRWSAASLVVIGDDVVEELVHARLPRRDGVVIVCLAEGEHIWRGAVTVGAEHVVSLPAGDRWLLDRLAIGTEGPVRSGVVVAVAPASGGAGASTFAVTIARVLASSMRTVVIDADPWAAGLEIMLGIEDVTGLRWPDLADTRGRLRAPDLVESLPRIDSLSVLSCSRSQPVAIEATPFDAVLDAAIRGFDAVVVDLPRAFDAIYDCTTARATRAAVVATTRVRSVVASRLVIAQFASRVENVDLVTRADGRGLATDAVEITTGLRESARLPQSPRVPMCSDAGELPSLRDPYGRACAEFVRGWVRGSRRAA